MSFRVYTVRLVLVSREAHLRAQTGSQKIDEIDTDHYQDSKIALGVALEQDKKVNEAERDSIKNCPNADVKEVDPLMIEDRFEVANLKARLGDPGSGYRRLSNVSDRSERSSAVEQGAGSIAVPSPLYEQPSRDVRILRASDTTIVATEAAAAMRSESFTSPSDRLCDSGRKYRSLLVFPPSVVTHRQPLDITPTRQTGVS